MRPRTPFAPPLAFASLLLLGSVACTRAESPADQVVALPSDPPAPEPVLPRTNAWVEPLHLVSHGAADVDVSYYELHLPSAAASETISTHLHDWVTATVASITRDAEDAASEDDHIEDLPRFSVRIACNPHVVTPSLVSLACRVETASGGAHASLVVETFTFAVDGDTARAVGIDDLFLDPRQGRAALGERCLAELREQEALWVTAGNVTDLHEMVDTFHVEPGKIVVTFAPYEVGPYAEGAHVVEVPFGALRGLRPTWAHRLADLP